MNVKNMSMDQLQTQLKKTQLEIWRRECREIKNKSNDQWNKMQEAKASKNDEAWFEAHREWSRLCSLNWSYNEPVKRLEDELNDYDYS
jgi:hypothetical protein